MAEFRLEHKGKDPLESDNFVANLDVKIYLDDVEITGDRLEEIYMQNKRPDAD
jgi:hypothetical protein